GGYSGEGNIDADPLFVDGASGDFHLSPGSPAIDAGHPLTDWSNEPWPNGGRVNMGAYGNTKEATRSSGDFEDLAELCDNWLEYEPILDIAPEPAGDGIINFLDFAIFARYWLW
ncbi:MAG: choice-of-anchor Q domain-containing protein, partial [Planctomycetota bacterium]